MDSMDDRFCELWVWNDKGRVSFLLLSPCGKAPCFFGCCLFDMSRLVFKILNSALIRWTSLPITGLVCTERMSLTKPLACIMHCFFSSKCKFTLASGPSENRHAPPGEWIDMAP